MYRGESTFMVEMIETSSIMNSLADRSLVLMDEVEGVQVHMTVYL